MKKEQADRIVEAVVKQVDTIDNRYDFMRGMICIKKDNLIASLRTALEGVELEGQLKCGEELSSFILNTINKYINPETATIVIMEELAEIIKQPHPSEREVLEDVCKDCNGSGQVPIGEEQGQILYTDCPCIKDHQSKRDLLIDFAKWIYNDSNSYYHIQNPLIDRYLKEKGETKCTTKKK